MNANQLKFGEVYRYTDQNKSIAVMYYGMSVDKYTFIPVNEKKIHFIGIPWKILL